MPAPGGAAAAPARPTVACEGGFHGGSAVELGQSLVTHGAASLGPLRVDCDGEINGQVPSPAAADRGRWRSGPAGHCRYCCYRRCAAVATAAAAAAAAAITGRSSHHATELRAADARAVAAQRGATCWICTCMQHGAASPRSDPPATLTALALAALGRGCDDGRVAARRVARRWARHSDGR